MYYIEKNDSDKKKILITIILLWLINLAVGFIDEKYRGNGTGTLLFILGMFIWGFMDERKKSIM